MMYQLPPVEQDGNVEPHNPQLWWLANEHKFPKLAKLAKKILCIPASSAPSERVFSSAGLTIANARAGLLPNRAQELVVVHAYLADEGANDQL